MADQLTIFNYYKRPEIQKEIIRLAKDREVAVKFGDKGFGKRPDTLNYAGDIVELAKQGATSFHASEELWKNPLQLEPTLKRSDLDKLRIGWDLVIDVDCPTLELSKIFTWLILNSLKDHNINSLSVKFSGNKGFHIGVPFESFPERIGNSEARFLFPEGPRKIAFYLLDYIGQNYVHADNDVVDFNKRFKYNIDELEKVTQKKISTKTHCCECGREIFSPVEAAGTEYICLRCGERLIVEEDAHYVECIKCGFPMHNVRRLSSKKLESGKISICKCGSSTCRKTINVFSIVEVDTLLISSRHLFRMPYCFNEKSGLISIPIDPGKILEFNKEDAKPENVKVSHFKFLDKSNVEKGEAKGLIVQAFDFGIKKEEQMEKTERQFAELTAAIPEQLFPPCMKNILKGLEDGRKRSLFILVNFLTSVGWDYDKIEELLRKWNKNNKEELREVYLIGQLRYHKQQKKKVLPPNCINKMYYQDLGICKPDELCSKIKNPVNYAKRKVYFIKK